MYGTCDLCSANSVLVGVMFRASGQEDALLDVCPPCAQDYIAGVAAFPEGA